MGKKAKNKKERALVKQAARDLGVDYHKGMGAGDLIRSEADRLVAQSAFSSGTDPDADASQWRRSITQSRRDLTPLNQDRLIEIANFLTSQNTLGSRISRVRTDFVIGSGLHYEAADETVQEWLDEFWSDPVNDMDQFQFQIVEYLGVNGELFLPIYTNIWSGLVRLGWIDPQEVEKVVPDPANRRIMRNVLIKAGTFQQDLALQQKVYDVVNVDTDFISPAFGFRTGDMLVFRINCAPDATRGRSDFEPVADLIDGWDRAVFNDIERSEIVKNFIWDVLLKGMSQEQIEKWSRAQAPPSPGSIRAHNEEVEWNAVAPDLKITESRVMTKGLRDDALGGSGLAPFFFGDTENSNRASSENLDLPILTGLTARQNKVKALFREIGDLVIDRKLMASPKIRREQASGSAQKMDRSFKVVMPELSTKDMTKIGAVMSGAASSLDLAVERRWITQDTAGRVFASLLQTATGIEYNVDEELAKAAEEQQQRDAADATKDYTPEKLKGLKDAAA